MSARAASSATLTAPERQRLAALEQVVERGLGSFIEVGQALIEIHAQRLYRASHATWEAYCRDRWGWTRQRAYQLMAAVEVSLSTRVDIPSERHARELARVPADERAEVLEEAGEGATVAQLHQVVERRAAAPSPAAPGQLGFGIPGVPRRDLSQWDTRPDTARWLVRWAFPRSAPMKVLEPSAGKGNIARALHEARIGVTCVELDAERAKKLRRSFTTHCRDFLEYAAELGPGDHFQAAVMNPPYENGQDLAHVLAALSLCPVVIVLARLALLEGQERREKLWNRHTLRRVCVLSERERFEGDVDGTPKSAFATFDIERGPGRSIVEWR